MTRPGRTISFKKAKLGLTLPEQASMAALARVCTSVCCLLTPLRHTVESRGVLS